MGKLWQAHFSTPALLMAACLLFAVSASHSRERCETGIPKLQPTWQVTGLRHPESAELSRDGTFLYVSMVDGEADAADQKGQIARIGLDGTLLDADWLVGLNAPKGMALKGKRLFVSDLTELLEIDTKNARIIARHKIPDSEFLNDVALAPPGSSMPGAILVSDSAKGRISRLHLGKVVEWLRDPQLRSINGLLALPDALLVTTMQGLLLAINWRTQNITVLGSGLGDGDGIAKLADQRYLVSEWPGHLYLVQPGQPNHVLLDTQAEKRLLNDFLLLPPNRNNASPVLIIPHLEPGALTAFQLDCG
ncbi:hypothetical protein C7S18_10530 [Ahniella affigens]|uniref:SMP-30/Gluconolactonase/LRE-like region domain-containing protein n=1 Tax=Ahniella affigens TaxID=2021234 RepID=A0A2P1PRX7_9GAMM|nr:hypothetical protein [Ahniella affigens]AVP97606.1 hypothetical protein C7S18_10530 [Ahniella affigens]